MAIQRMLRSARPGIVESVLGTSLIALVVLACSHPTVLPEMDGYGSDPALPPPHTSVLPTIAVAPARGWPDGGHPVAAPGFRVAPFATGLDHPRWLAVLPNGDVLVAESNGPEEPTKFGLRSWIFERMQKKAGSGVPSADRITLLRDTDGDGEADMRTVLIHGLRSPFGMARTRESLYIADTDALLRFSYRDGETSIAGTGEKVAKYPGGKRHWTRNVIASPDGSKLYVAVGSGSNVAEDGIAAEEQRALILEIDAESGSSRVYASGLRNPVGLDWQPDTGALWTAVNERDEIGPDLVPDYMTAVVDGGFYGWPYSYYGQHLDPRVEPQRPELVARAVVPDYALGAHTASLGLTFYRGDLFPQRYRGGAFVGQHGSWNRKPPSGYRVIFVPFANGQPAGEPEEILTGFLSEDGKALGRPVGVAVDQEGALLVADDVGNVVWRVMPDADAETLATRPKEPR